MPVRKSADAGAPEDGIKIQPRTRTAALCVAKSQVLLVEHYDSVQRKPFLSLPGGRVETGETPEQAAIREVFEETGYRVSLRGSPKPINYYYFLWQGRNVFCETYWFLADLAFPQPEEHEGDENVIAVHWRPLAELPEVLSYHYAIKRTALSLLAGNHYY